MRIELPDEAATIGLARQFQAALPSDTGGWTVLLDGELGSGKSTFARALIAAMGHNGPVPSPTYTLVEPYDTPAGSVYHIDLYRVAAEEELRYLGWNELDEGFRLVEWPDRASGLTEQADVRISLQYHGDGRLADVIGLTHRGADCVSRLSQAMISR